MHTIPINVYGECMGDNNKIAGHILPREFYRDLMTFFMDMGQNRLNHHSVMGGVVNLIGHALDKEKRVVANHQIPQEYIERAHDELIHATDRYVYNVAHLIKIHKFIPYLIERHGERIRYEDPDTLPKSMPKGEWEDSVYCRLDFEEASDVKRFNAEQRVNFWEINLPVYQDINNLWEELKSTVESSYTNLESLRFLMTPET